MKTPILPVVGVLVAGMLLAGCSGDDSDSDSNDDAPIPSSMTISSAPQSMSSEAAEITTDEAQKLCDMIRPELDKWRSQGIVVGRTGFNVTVHNWGIRTGKADDIHQDRGVLDTVTTKQCPDIRTQALQALNVPDLASALAGIPMPR